MLKRFILCALLFFQSTAFAYEKQNDEFSCGAVSAYNLISELCPECRNNNFNTIYKLLKTNRNGTTAYNICNGLDKYFSKQNINYNIYYYGIKKVRRYKNGTNINFDNVKKYISAGYTAILNIGTYKKTGNYYTRQYGHYVNLVSLKDSELKIFDPYDKENEFSYWKTKLIKANLKNSNDNEKYEKAEEYFLVTTPVNYFKDDEYAVINGIILVGLQKQL